MLNDLRSAFRQLRKTPGFTAVAVLTLALGIGANTAIFSFINAFFLKNFTVRAPEELVSVYTTDQDAPGFLGLSRLNFEDYRDQNPVFAGMAAYGFAPVNALLNGEPAQIFGEIVSGNFFDLLGVRPALGRAFLPEEYASVGTHSVVVLGYSFWQGRLGGDPRIVGRPITLNGTAFTVIGVAPADFRGLNTLNSPAFWVTTASHRQIYSGTELDFYQTRRALLFNAVARLKPGVSLGQADAALRPLSAELARQYPNDNHGRGVRLVPLAEAGIDPNQRQNFKLAGTLLLSLSGVVLLIACANIANLLLARAQGRQREIALRLALGASRGRLVRQFLTESTLLALLGGGAGLLVAGWTQQLLWSVRPPFFPQDFTVGLDGRVLGFGLLVALATGILFGLAPAWNATKPDLTSALKAETTGTAARAPLVSFRNFLIAGQIALSVIALVVAGLFIRSLQQAQRANVGWNTRDLALLSVDLGAQGYTPDRLRSYYRSALEQARRLPGVIDVTIGTTPLLNGGGFLRTLRPQGDNENLRTRGSLMSYSYVWPGYLKTVGIPLVAGRDFSETDDDQHPIAVIINQHLARLAWPDRSPLGQAIKLFGTEVPAIVVGVVQDVTFDNVGEDPQPYAFFSLAQDLSRGTAGTIHVRTERDAAALIPALRQQLQSLDPTLPFVNVSTVEENIRQGLWASRTGAALLSVFGGLALLLAAIGVYGIMAYVVSKRIREIGIRVAIGAQRGDIMRLILGQGLLIAGSGLCVGLLAAFGVARYFQKFLFGIGAGDLLTYAAITVILAATALLACYLPARRATKVDPLVALRTE